jgi:hypothetical protein
VQRPTSTMSKSQALTEEKEKKEKKEEKKEKAEEEEKEKEEKRKKSKEEKEKEEVTGRHLPPLPPRINRNGEWRRARGGEDLLRRAIALRMASWP